MSKGKFLLYSRYMYMYCIYIRTQLLCRYTQLCSYNLCQIGISYVHTYAVYGIMYVYILKNFCYIIWKIRVKIIQNILAALCIHTYMYVTNAQQNEHKCSCTYVCAQFSCTVACNLDKEQINNNITCEQLDIHTHMHIIMYVCMV